MPRRSNNIVGHGLVQPTLVVLNQYYAPGYESTAHLLTELCEALADDFDVTVVTGTVYGAPKPERTVRNGVRIVRVGSTSYDRSRLVLRGLNYVSYIGLALLAGLQHRRPELVLCMSDPPFVSAVGVVVARRHRVPLLVVTQDVFPEIAVALGRLDNRIIVGVLDRLVRFGPSHATRVVAIGDQMRRRLVAKGVNADAITVIPNWTDTESLVPREHGEHVGARARAHRPVRRHALRATSATRRIWRHSFTPPLTCGILTISSSFLIGSGARGVAPADLVKRLGARERALPAVPAA